MTAAVGALTLRAGITEPTGCVTALPVLRGPALPDMADLVFGGHDLVTIPVIKKAEALADSGVIPARLVVAVSDDLAEVEPWTRPVPVAVRQADAPGRPAFDAAFARKDRGRRRAPVLQPVAGLRLVGEDSVRPSPFSPAVCHHRSQRPAPVREGRTTCPR
ncbi:hypothetical protein [Streptomyces sp. BRA346]|uniref:hypothetical protein n=1 Tax=Streptomyces sp. BRA346 TaxID=2878199 RepID=UPI004062A3C9